MIHINPFSFGSAPASEPQPISWFKLEETSGTSPVDSITQTTATSINCVLGLTGVENLCYGFRADAEIEIPHRSEFSFVDGSGNKPFSVTFWIKPQASGTQWLIQKRGYISNDSVDWQIHVLGNDTLNFEIYDTNGNKLQAKSTNTITLNQWQQVKATFGGTNGSQKIELDGVLTQGSAITTFGNMTNNQDSILVGRTDWTEDYKYNGDLDELKIWDIEL